MGCERFSSKCNSIVDTFLKAEKHKEELINSWSIPSIKCIIIISVASQEPIISVIELQYKYRIAKPSGKGVNRLACSYMLFIKTLKPPLTQQQFWQFWFQWFLTHLCRALPWSKISVMQWCQEEKTDYDRGLVVWEPWLKAYFINMLTLLFQVLLFSS